MFHYKELVPYFQRYKKIALLVPVLTVIEALCETSIPFMMKYMVDKGLYKSDLPELVKIALLMTVVSIAYIAVGGLSGHLGAVCVSGLSKNLRHALFQGIMYGNSSDNNRFSASSTLTRITKDVNQVQNAVSMFRTVLRGPIVMFIAFGFAFHIDPQISMIFLLAIPIFSILVLAITKISQKYFRQAAIYYDDMNRVVLENHRGIHLVKCFGLQGIETGLFIKKTEGLRNHQLWAETLAAINNPLLQLISNFCIIGVLWFCKEKVTSGIISTGGIISFISYANQILYQILLIAMVLVPIASAQVSCERILEILKSDSRSDSGKDNSETADTNGNICLKHVYFDYAGDVEPQECLLRDICLEIPVGSSIGIIGVTGSGKSTILSLLGGKYPATYGTIIEGNKVISEEGKNLAKADVAVVLQKNLLFTGTVRENICFGKPDAKDDYMKNASKIATSSDFVETLDDGYDSMVNAGGSNFSGGQRQRLCIARALTSGKKIILLDDCTSALDRKTERRVADGLLKNVTATRVIASSKVSTVMNCDQIAVLDKGKICALGTHRELYENCHIYRQFCESQKAGVS